MCGSFSLFARGPNGHFIEILLTNEPILLPVALHAEDSEFLLRSISIARLLRKLYFSASAGLHSSILRWRWWMGRIVARVKEQGIRQQIYEDEIRSDCFGGAAA